MENQKKAILFGDYSNPNYHPVTGIDQQLRSMLADEVDVTATEDYGSLTQKDLSAYDLIICYCDQWKEKTSPALVHAILDFVSAGKGILVIHNGIFMQHNHELAQMVGAKFAGHPAYCNLEFQISAPDHPIMQGLDGFAIDDEPYRFEFDPFTEKTILMEYKHEEKSWPGAWALAYGLGKVVYLAPGHDQRSFNNASFQELIRRSAQWLCN